MTTRAAIDDFLAQPALALVGASRTGGKFGNYALRELRSKGYRVYPVHPAATQIDGVPCAPDFAHLPEPVGGVVVVVPPVDAAPVVREAAAAGIKRVWLQQGSESPNVLKTCADVGVEPVAGECVLMYAHPTGFHKVHRVLWKMLRKVPA